MVTALALYAGRSLAEFELVGLTTNPEAIEHVLTILAAQEPHLVRKRRKRTQNMDLRLMPPEHPE
jgi:hypothetical protein